MNRGITTLKTMVERLENIEDKKKKERKKTKLFYYFRAQVISEKAGFYKTISVFLFYIKR